MKRHGIDRPAVVDRIGPWLVLVLPILIGLLFWADSCGHADSIGYREMIARTWNEGQLPLTRLEWYHPGQYLMAAPIFGLGLSLGIWDEALRPCTLLNFLSLGFAALMVFRLLREFFPDRSSSLALLGGIAFGTSPGWLWMSQMALTDVLGHALVLIWSCRLILHEIRSRDGREDPRTAWHRIALLIGWSFTGFLATYAILIRVSSALFGLLFVYLAIRALAATADKRLRIWKLLALLFGGILPVTLVYGHLIHQFGWPTFSNTYFSMSQDNAGLRQPLEIILGRWHEHIELGSGPLVFWVGLSGLLLFLIGGIHRKALQLVRDRRTILWIALLVTIPYFLAVARNRASYEFRYMIPAMAILSLGILAWGWLVDRFLGVRATMLMALAILVLNLVSAGPWLLAFGTRTHFSEAGARAIVDRVEPGSLVFAHMAGAHIGYRSKQRCGIIGVRNSESESGPDFWNLSWKESLCVMENAIANGRKVYSLDEESLAPFVADLDRRGWQIATETTIAFDGLRNAHDANLATMHLENALRPRALRIMSYRPPGNTCLPPVRLEISGASGEEAGLHFELTSEAGKGMAWRLIFYSDGQERWTELPGQIMLPTSTRDDLFVLSSSPEASSMPALAFCHGTVDHDGKAKIWIPADYVQFVSGSFLTVLVHDPGKSWVHARWRSPSVRVP